jgi:flagellar motility protein MotE (MotC chaperone)
MKKFMMLGMTALVLFSLSAGASWFLQKARLAAATEPTMADSTERAAERQTPRHHSWDMEEDRDAFMPTESHGNMRPPYTPAANEAVQLANSLRTRLAAVREREALLLGRQKQLELVFNDIKSERASIDEMRKQVAEEMKAVERQLLNLEKKRAELDDKQQEVNTHVKEMEKNVVQLDGMEQGNLKKIADMYDSMAPESAGKILKQLAESGKMDTAVKLLGLMKERQAAKVLADLEDPALAAQLLEKMKDVKRPAKKQPGT